MHEMILVHYVRVCVRACVGVYLIFHSNNTFRYTFFFAIMHPIFLADLMV